MTTVQNTREQLQDLHYRYDMGLITKADFQAEGKRIYEETNKRAATLNSRRQQYEGFLAQYIQQGKGVVASVKNQFGKNWPEFKAQLDACSLDPYAMKEAYLKACDFFGIERPSVNNLQETEVTDRKDFWNTELNPVTMTKVESYAFAEIADDTLIDYDYTF